MYYLDFEKVGPLNLRNNSILSSITGTQPATLNISNETYSNLLVEKKDGTNWINLDNVKLDITVEAMAGIDTKPTIAVLGPCIHPDFYEFGEEQMKKICEIFGEDIRAKTREGSLALNLPKMVEIALIKNNITELVRFDKCTSNSEEFWSYRVRNDEKRQAVIGWIKPKETSFD